MKIFIKLTHKISKYYLKVIRQKNIWWPNFISSTLQVVREPKELGPLEILSKKVLV